MARAREGLVRFSASGMAGPDSAALLQLSRDGRPWNNLHRGDGSGSAAAVAGESVCVPFDALVGAGVRAACFHRPHRGMADLRARVEPAAAFWLYAHRPWGFSTAGCWAR